MTAVDVYAISAGLDDIAAILDPVERARRVDEELDALHKETYPFRKGSPEWNGVRDRALEMFSLRPERGDDYAQKEKEFARDWNMNVQALRSALNKAAQSPKPGNDNVDGRFGNDVSMTDAGIYYRNEFLCPPIEVLGLTRAPDGKGCGTLFAIKNANGERVEVVVDYKRLHTDTKAIVGELADAGLQVAPDDAKHVARVIARINSGNRVNVLRNTGWHNVGGVDVFCLPPEVIAAPVDAEFRVQFAGVNPFARGGTLEGWQDNVSIPARGHDVLQFALSAAFTGPILRLLKAESVVVNLRGSSTAGKSTSLYTAVSVWAAGREGPMISSWNATRGAIEALLERNSDTITVLDELGTGDPRIVGSLVYDISSGKGRARLSRDATPKDQRTWRNVVLSTSEVTLTDLMASAGQKTKAGQLLRFANVEVDRGQGCGAFNNVAEPERLALALKKAVDTDYGHAGPAFVEAIIGHGVDAASIIAEALVEEFVARYPKLIAQAGRVVRTFATIAAAGEMATSFGITKWEKGEATRAAIWAFEAALGIFGEGAEDIESRQSVEHVARLIFEGRARFSKTGDTHVPDRRLGVDFGDVFVVPAETFRAHFCDGRDPRTVARALANANFLETEGEHLAGRATVGGQRQRVYKIKKTIAPDPTDDVC